LARRKTSAVQRFSHCSPCRLNNAFSKRFVLPSTPTPHLAQSASCRKPKRSWAARCGRRSGDAREKM